MELESSNQVLTSNLGFDRIARVQRHRYELTDTLIVRSDTVEPQLLWRDDVVLDRLLLLYQGETPHHDSLIVVASGFPRDSIHASGKDLDGEWDFGINRDPHCLTF